MAMLIVPGVTYFGGFSQVELTEPRYGRLVFEDDALTLSRVQNVKRNRDFRNIWLCRTLDVAAMDVSSEQIAQSKVDAALNDDRATLLIRLKNGDVGNFTVNKKSTASLLGLLTPWLREHGITLSSPAPVPAAPVGTPRLIADELLKLAQLRDSGVLSDEEFARLKAQLIRD
jgi:hypothetical protein